MAEKVTEVISAPEQPDPVIKRDEKGHVSGHFKYMRHLVPDGQEVVQTLEVGGVVKGVARWTAHSLPGKNAIVQGRLVVGDDCGAEKLTQAEPEEL